MPTILITTDYLTPGDEVDTYLTGLGYTTRHDPMRGKRSAAGLIAALDGGEGALIGGVVDLVGWDSMLLDIAVLAVLSILVLVRLGRLQTRTEAPILK